MSFNFLDLPINPDFFEIAYYTCTLFIISGAFYLYAGFALIGVIFLVLCLPETKGKQLEEVEAMFMGSLIVPCKRTISYETMN